MLFIFLFLFSYSFIFYLFIFLFLYACICMYVCTYVGRYVCIYACMHVGMYVMYAMYVVYVRYVMYVMYVMYGMVFHGMACIVLCCVVGFDCIVCFDCIAEGSLEVKLPTIWTDEKQRWEESEKRREEARESLRRKKIQVREKVGKSRNTMFFQWFVAPEGRKVGSLKRRVRSQLARWEMKTQFWREPHLQVKKYKTRQLRSTFRSWDVEKVHAAVARSTCRSQNVQSTSCSDHFWKYFEVKSAKNCGVRDLAMIPKKEDLFGCLFFRWSGAAWRSPAMWIWNGRFASVFCESCLTCHTQNQGWQDVQMWTQGERQLNLGLGSNGIPVWQMLPGLSVDCQSWRKTWILLWQFILVTIQCSQNVTVYARSCLICPNSCAIVWQPWA